MSARNFVVRLFSSLWSGLDGLRKVLHLIVLLGMFLIFFGAFSGSQSLIPQQGALLLQPYGALVDQLDGDPYDRALAELMDETIPQTLVQDVVDALTYARDDTRISALHLDLSAFGGGGLSKLRRVAAAIEDFKSSGKVVVASADFYSQSGYYLAAHADEIYLHPEGMVFMRGYGGYSSYYKDLIENLRLDWNVFKVGTHKSFVEPYTRMDMSPEDREARTRLIDQFWGMYLEDVAAARDIDASEVDDFVQNLVAHTEAAGGDLAAAALNAGLVDDLLSRAEIRALMRGYVGVDPNDNDSYRATGSVDYLAHAELMRADDVQEENVAVVLAVGSILDGSQSSGTIGGDSTAALLRRALADDSVKAVVLRVDSPGGSVFASEVIAHEIEALRDAGKPVVASMGSVAASGGYWISVVADRILASPATVTGSIGVFGMFPTYQRTLETVGVKTDGVGTTPWVGQLRPDREMSEPMKALFQLSIADTYDDFISGVAEARNMDKDAVDRVAQGQVWSGTDALNFGLIDELGGYEDAIAVAAELAGLEAGQYGRKNIETMMSPTEQIILDFLSATSRAGLDLTAIARPPSALEGFATQLQRMLAEFTQFNDPKGIYSHCFCELN